MHLRASCGRPERARCPLATLFHHLLEFSEPRRRPSPAPRLRIVPEPQFLFEVLHEAVQEGFAFQVETLRGLGVESICVWHFVAMPHAA